MTLLISPAGVLTPANDTNVWAPYATLVAAYGPFFFQQNRRTAFLVLAALTLVIMRPWEPSVTVMTIGLLRTAVGPLLALYLDARRRMVFALVERAERAERAERERHLLAEQARAEERARLAGEMHDVVTHRVSLMVLQAGALRVTAQDEETRQAAEELRAAGCEALEELRDLVGILRTTPEGDQTPSVGGFADLVAESTAVGTPAELIEDGDPALASPVVGRTACRVLREALTNVRKHAPGARVTVRVEYDEAQVRLTVHNTPPAGRASSALADTGSGLGIARLAARRAHSLRRRRRARQPLLGRPPRRTGRAGVRTGTVRPSAARAVLLRYHGQAEGHHALPRRDRPGAPEEPRPQLGPRPRRPAALVLHDRVDDRERAGVRSARGRVDRAAGSANS